MIPLCNIFEMPTFRNGDQISGCQRLIRGSGRKEVDGIKEGNMRNLSDGNSESSLYLSQYPEGEMYYSFSRY